MTATDTPSNTKAGWSSYCRRDQHRTCTTLGARCTCTCHGRTGQAPPTPPAPKEPPAMPDAAPLAAVPDVPATSSIGKVQLHECDHPGCGRGGFASLQGVQVHKARSHRDSPPKSRSNTSRARSNTPPAPDPARGPTPDAVHVIAVAQLHGDQLVLEGATFTTTLDADRAHNLLTRLGHRPQRVTINAQEG